MKRNSISTALLGLGSGSCRGAMGIAARAGAKEPAIGWRFPSRCAHVDCVRILADLY